jgi:hypothetical protein
MPEVKDKMTGKTVAQMSYDEKGMDAANKMVANDPGLVVTDGRNRSQQMYEGGGMTGMSMIGKPQYMKGGKMMYKHGGKTHNIKEMGHGGMTPEMKKYEEGGKTKKAVDASKNPGLSKLPKEVRNKMGYMKEGGKANKRSEFQSAFRKARNAGKKTFMYKGKLYNTKLKKTSKKKYDVDSNIKKQKKYDVDSGIKKQKKYDVDSGIKNQKKYDVDSGIKNQKKYSAFLKKGGKV